MDEAVSTFLEAARGFRSALASEETDRDEFARRLRNAVARVYLAATGLPRGGSVSGDTPTLGADQDHSRELELRTRARLGPADTFVDVWDPTQRDARPETIERSLAQELVEIDEDLARCVVWLEEPHRPDTLWDVWCAFEEHWGKHAVDVLRPLHQIARGGVG
jgi:hypothetical protein